MVTTCVPAQAMKETTEIKEQESLQLTRNLLRIAIFNISYIRGLFPEKFFHDTSLSALGMKIKKLLPMDLEARRLIDWMEKGVYDALQKKYLKTLLFSLCEGEEGPLLEEYTFSFSYSSSSDEVSMHVDRDGRHGKAFNAKSASHLTQSQMKTSACRMIRTLVQLMQTLSCVPDERTITMKLFYYDDVTPVNYEPPFFRCCTYDQHRRWLQPPLRMKVGDVNSKYFAIALKVKSALDPCEDENDENKDANEVMKEDANELSAATTCDRSAGSESSSESENSDVSTRPRRSNRSTGNEAQTEGDGPKWHKPVNRESEHFAADDENTEDIGLEAENLTKVKEWVLSRNKDTLDISDILAQFPEISVVHTEELVSCMVKEGLLFVIGRDLFRINNFEKMKHGFEQLTTDNRQEFTKNEDEIQQVANITDLDAEEKSIYIKALYHVLPLEHITIAQLQSKLGSEVNQTTARKLLARMASDGFIEETAASRRIGRRVIHSEETRKRLQDMQLALKPQNEAQMGLELNQRAEEHMNPVTPAIGTYTRRSGRKNLSGENMDASTYGGVHSVGSDLTRCGPSGQRMASSTSQMNLSTVKGSACATGSKVDMTKRTLSRESQTPAKEAQVSTPEKRSILTVPGKKGMVEEFRDSQETSYAGEQRRMRKASMVKEPIFQSVKRIKS